MRISLSLVSTFFFSSVDAPPCGAVSRRVGQPAASGYEMDTLLQNFCSRTNPLPDFLPFLSSSSFVPFGWMPQGRLMKAGQTEDSGVPYEFGKRG